MDNVIKSLSIRKAVLGMQYFTLEQQKLDKKRRDALRHISASSLALTGNAHRPLAKAISRNLPVLTEHGHPPLPSALVLAPSERCMEIYAKANSISLPNRVVFISTELFDVSAIQEQQADALSVLEAANELINTSNVLIDLREDPDVFEEPNGKSLFFLDYGPIIYKGDISKNLFLHCQHERIRNIAENAVRSLVHEAYPESDFNFFMFDMSLSFREKVLNILLCDTFSLDMKTTKRLKRVNPHKLSLFNNVFLLPRSMSQAELNASSVIHNMDDIVMLWNRAVSEGASDGVFDAFDMQSFAKSPNTATLVDFLYFVRDNTNAFDYVKAYMSGIELNDLVRGMNESV